MGRRSNSTAAAHRNPSTPHAYSTLGGISALLVLVTLAVFGPSIRFQWVNYDDNEYVYAQPRVAAGVTAEGVAWAFTHRHASNWHPLTTFSHMLDCQIYGLAPAGHHLGNVLLHAATAVILLWVLRRMTGRLWPSTLVTALFALHPLRAESVAWISERKDVLSGLLFVLTLAAYARYTSGPFRWSRYLLVVLMLALGLLAKPMLVTVPLVLLLLDVWPLGRAGYRRLVAEKIPLLALSAASCAVTVWAQRTAMADHQQVTLWARIANAIVSYVAYLGKFFCPTDLAVLYPYPTSSPPAWQLAGAALVLAGISAAAVAYRKKHPYLLVGWLWYLGMLVPVIGLIQVGAQSMADRYTYLPQIGLAIALVWTAAQWVETRPVARRVGGAVAAMLLILLSVAAWRQTGYWRNSETLWVHTLQCTSQNYVAHYNYGRWLVDQGRPAEAIVQCRASLAINPRQPRVHDLLGNVHGRQGKLDEAMACYHQALEVDSRYAPSCVNLAFVLSQQGRTAEAIACYEKALDINPEDAETHKDLAVLLATRGQLDRAIEHCRRSLAIDPRCADAYGCLALALDATGRGPEAMAAWRELARLQPDAAASIRARLPLDPSGQPPREMPSRRVREAN